MLRSVGALYPLATTVVVWNLGLTPEELAAFHTEFQIPIHRFPYENYPAFYDITVNSGQYAWKSACIELTLKTAVSEPAVYLWLDAGNMIIEPLKDLILFIQKQGFFTPMSGGSIREFIHPGTLAALQRTYADFKGKTMRNGAILGFYTGYPWVNEMFQTWRRWCDTEAILAPPGSDRSNHRQDQALLTIVYWDSAKKRGLNSMREFHSIQTHCDCD
jgi:hypothetical protein